jgi:hypothetical protein
VLDYGLVLKRGELFLASQIETDGSGENAAGLYFRDTRFLNRLDLTLNGETLKLLEAITNDAAHAAVTLTNHESRIGDHLVWAHQIAVEAQILLDTGLTVTFLLQNFSDRDLDLAICLTSVASSG